MKTDDLIAALSTDAGVKAPSPDRTFSAALVGSVVVAGGLLLATMGVRPDFMAALGTLRFDFKFVLTIALAVSAGLVFHRSLFPVSSTRPGPAWLLLAPALLFVGVVAELFALPGEAWQMSAEGKNALLCLSVIPALGIVPLGLMLWTLRRGASTRPRLAGFAAGLLAGGIAATFYAANCTDDSPLFVATWYPLGILALGAVGALLGRIVSRW